MFSLHTAQFSNLASFVFCFGPRYLSLFFLAMLVSRASEWLIRKKRKKETSDAQRKHTTYFKDKGACLQFRRPY